MNHDMRIEVTRRMLKEGLLRCLTEKRLSKINVIELCRESGVNRATFYNHYESPTMLLKEIAEDYAQHLKEIYYDQKYVLKNSEECAILACLDYLYDKKKEIKVLLSENSENCISGFGLDIINREIADRHKVVINKPSNEDRDDFLYAILTASAAYGLIQVWLVRDLDRTPEQIVNFLKQTFGKSLFR